MAGIRLAEALSAGFEEEAGAARCLADTQVVPTGVVVAVVERLVDKSSAVQMDTARVEQEQPWALVQDRFYRHDTSSTNASGRLLTVSNCNTPAFPSSA